MVQTFVFLPTKNDKKEPLELAPSCHPLDRVNIPSFEKFEALQSLKFWVKNIY